MGEQSLIRSHHVQFNFHFHSDDVSISVDRTKTRTWQGQHFEFYISPSFWWSSWSPQWRPAALDAYSFFLSFISDSLDFFSLSFPFFTFPWTNLHGSVSSSRCQFASRGPFNCVNERTVRINPYFPDSILVTFENWKKRGRKRRRKRRRWNEWELCHSMMTTSPQKKKMATRSDGIGSIFQFTNY